MRIAALGEGSMFSSSQGDFYQDMFDDQISMELSKGRGLGLADVLVRQRLAAVWVGAGRGSVRSRSADARCFFDRLTVQPLAQSKEDFVKHDVAARATCRRRRSGVIRARSSPRRALETGWGARCRTRRADSGAPICLVSKRARAGKARPRMCRRWNSKMASPYVRSSASARTDSPAGQLQRLCPADRQTTLV